MYIPRELEPAIRKHLYRKAYTLITGARQTGKKLRNVEVFRKAYPKYGIQIISHDPNQKCLWFLKLTKA